MYSHFQKQIDGINQHIQRQVDERAGNEIDHGFAALGKKFEGIFGAGNGADLQASSPTAYRRRIAVLNDLKANPPKTRTTLKDAVRTRAAELFGDMATDGAVTTPPGAPKTTAFTQQEWDAGGVLRPTDRAGSPDVVAPELKARKTVAEHQRNLAAVNGTDADANFLP
jgi:hypothetical protein